MPQWPIPQPGPAANTSGTGAPAPPEVRRWNWGAFWFTWLWGAANGVWLSLLILILPGLWAFVLGAKGSEWAWRNRRFESIEHFRAVQRAWSVAGWVTFLISTVLSVLLALVMTALRGSGVLNDF